MTRALVLGALVATLAACGGGAAAPAGGEDGRLASSAQTTVFEAMVAAPTTVTYGGTRRVELYPTIDGVPQAAIFREQVYADGAGGYAVETTDVIEPQLFGFELDVFRLLQDARQGFSYRYRDFLIRDLELFFANYQVVHFAQTLQVAGRACEGMRIQRKRDADRVYVLAVDQQTGVVLRTSEEALDGSVLALVEFESFTLTPDLAGVSLLSWGQEAAIDLDDPQASGIDFAIEMPALVPDGFQLRQTSRVLDLQNQRPWAKLVYGDGVEQVFFLHGGTTQQAHGGSGFRAVDWNAGNRVALANVGPWAVAQGDVRGQRVIAMGKVDSAELLAMIESALY